MSWGSQRRPLGRVESQRMREARALGGGGCVGKGLVASLSRLNPARAVPRPWWRLSREWGAKGVFTGEQETLRRAGQKPQRPVVCSEQLWPQPLGEYRVSRAPCQPQRQSTGAACGERGVASSTRGALRRLGKWPLRPAQSFQAGVGVLLSHWVRRPCGQEVGRPLSPNPESCGQNQTPFPRY